MNIYLNYNDKLTTEEKNGNLLKRLFKFLSSRHRINIAATGDEDERRSLFLSLDNARHEWIEAARNFEQVSEQDIVDYYIYRIKASQARYEYFLKKAKELRLKHDNIRVHDNTF